MHVAVHDQRWKLRRSTWYACAAAGRMGAMKLFRPILWLCLTPTSLATSFGERGERGRQNLHDCCFGAHVARSLACTRLQSGFSRSDCCSASWLRNGGCAGAVGGGMGTLAAVALLCARACLQPGMRKRCLRRFRAATCWRGCVLAEDGVEHADPELALLLLPPRPELIDNTDDCSVSS